MRRRDIIKVVAGSAIAWPLAARAQQPTIPVVAFLRTGSADTESRNVAAFRIGLNETGYVEGQNLTVEVPLAGKSIRSSAGTDSRLGPPPRGRDRHGRHPAGCARGESCNSNDPNRLRRRLDPVQLGLVASLAHPGGNATGTYFLATEITAKRLRLLNDMVPQAVRVAVLVNPINTDTAKTTLRDAQEAAPAVGLKLQPLNATTIGELDSAFETMRRERADALIVAGDAFFLNRRTQFVTLTARDRIPATFPQRAFVEAGGLMSYDADNPK